ncbi:MAG: hypothetical protein FWD52_06775 [Candidatus Bathyarchaeota archaeon]|nr:hypothetical protein [Candidatus Termiticorpusculum sp.]
MSDRAELEERFKLGVLKELHRRQLLTKDELDRAIKVVICENNSGTSATRAAQKVNTRKKICTLICLHQ